MHNDLLNMRYLTLNATHVIIIFYRHLSLVLEDETLNILTFHNTQT
jgi:hypothetical protein